MGAIGKTARGVKKAAHAGKSTVHATVSWPAALVAGPLLDVRLRRDASDSEIGSVHAAARRSMERANSARWVSAIFCIAIIALVIWHNGWALAPLIPLAWAILARRAAWWRGQPTLRRMLSPGAWVVMGLSLIPVTVFLFEALFEPLDGELHGWLTHGAGWAAVVVAFISALAVAERLKRPAQAVVIDVSDAQLIAGITGMTEAQYAKSVLPDKLTGKPTFVVGRYGDQLRAVLPVGLDRLLEDDAGIEQRLAARAPDWEIGVINLKARSLALVPVSDETTAQREARAASGGFTGTAINRESRVVVDSGIAWDSPAS